MRVFAFLTLFGALLMSLSARAQCLDMANYGAIGDGMHPNDAAFNSAWAALPSSGGCLSFPSGKFLFNSAIIETLPATRAAIGIYGAGANLTMLYWPAPGGMALTFTSQLNSVHFHDFSVTTGTSGTGTAISLTQTGGSPGPGSPWSEFSNITVRGDDGGGMTDVWAVGVRVHAVSSINFYNTNIFGSSAGAGIGLILEGDVPSAKYGVLYNITSSSFNFLNPGILYGSYVQGVTVNQSNFNGGVGGPGIQTFSGESGTLSQLAVSNSQFNTGASQISLSTAVDSVLLSNNVITVNSSGNIGVYLQASFGFEITGNYFNIAGSPTATYGVVVGPPGFGVITGNSFQNVALGVNLLSGSSGITVMGNSYGSGVVKYVNNGSSPAPGTPTP